MAEDLHIVPHSHAIGKLDRNRLNKHNSFVLWFTGLSGSGKSTIANEVEQKLFREGVRTYILDGDNVRKGLSADLDFSLESRKENIRRIGEVASLFCHAGIVTIAAFISPLRADREKVRSIIGGENFLEIFIDTPLEICEQRDVKGLYKKARAGEIKNFTGIDSPFEPPEKPDVHVRTVGQTIEESVNQIFKEIKLKLEL